MTTPPDANDVHVVMTVGELRALLAELPYDMPVAVDAYEEGLTIQAVHVRTCATRWKAPPLHPSQGELFDVDEANPDWAEGPTVLVISRHDEDE
jgi:hypothetical protein